MDDRRFMCGKYLYLNKDWSLGFHVGRNNADDLAGWIVDHVQDEDLKEWFFSGLFGEGLFFDDCNTAEFTYLGDLLIQAAQHVDGAAVIRDKIIQSVKKESRWRPEILPLLYKTKWAEWRKNAEIKPFCEDK